MGFRFGSCGWWNCAQGRAGGLDIGQARGEVPTAILAPLGQGRCGRVHQGVEDQLAGIAVGLLERVQQAGDEGALLPALDGLEFAPRQFQGLFLLGGGQVVEVQDDPIAAGRVLAAVDAVEGVGLVGQPLQVHEPGEGAQLAAERDLDVGLQQPGGELDLVGAQLLPAADRHQIGAFRQTEDTDAARAGALGGVEADLAPCQQQPRRDEARVEPRAQLACNPLGLGVDAVGLALGDLRVLTQVVGVPVLDLQDEDPRRTDDDGVDLVGTDAGVLGVIEIGEDDPVARGGLELGAQPLAGEALAFVDEDAAGDVSDHCAFSLLSLLPWLEFAGAATLTAGRGWGKRIRGPGGAATFGITPADGPGSWPRRRSSPDTRSSARRCPCRSPPRCPSSPGLELTSITTGP